MRQIVSCSATTALLTLAMRLVAVPSESKRGRQLIRALSVAKHCCPQAPVLRRINGDTVNPLCVSAAVVHQVWVAYHVKESGGMLVAGQNHVQMRGGGYNKN